MWGISRIGKFIQTESKLGVWGRRREKNGGYLLMGKEFLFGVRKIFWSQIMMMFAQLCENAKKKKNTLICIL